MIFDILGSPRHGIRFKHIWISSCTINPHEERLGSITYLGLFRSPFPSSCPSPPASLLQGNFDHLDYHLNHNHVRPTPSTLGYGRPCQWLCLDGEALTW